jgi:hypothetical protein
VSVPVEVVFAAVGVVLVEVGDQSCVERRKVNDRARDVSEQLTP